MDCGLASASLQRPGMTRLTKVDTLGLRVLTQAEAARTSKTPMPLLQRDAWGRRLGSVSTLVNRASRSSDDSPCGRDQFGLPMF